MNTPIQSKNKPSVMDSVTYGDLTWINVEHPKEADLACLSETYPFHPLDLADCISKMQRPKLDVYKDYLFLIFHYSVWDKVKRISSAEQVAVFIGSNYVITVHNGKFTPLVELYNRCRSDEQTRREHFSNGSGYLTYKIIDCAVDSYFPILDKLLDLMDKAADSVFDVNVEAAKEVFILRRDLITQRRIMFPNRVTFAAVEPKLARFSKVDLVPHFGDVMDHMNKICETLDELKEIIEAFKDTDYILSTNRIKNFLRLLTIIASAALPFIIISSIYAMNIHLPGSTSSGLFMFIILLIVMGLVSGLTYLFLRGKRLV